MTSSGPTEKSADAYRTISEVAIALNLPQHVLRFWETRFSQVRPLKRGGNRRYYRPEDVDLLAAIRQLLYSEGYTIKGVQRLLREQGPRAVAGLAARRGGTDLSGHPGRHAAATAKADQFGQDPVPHAYEADREEGGPGAPSLGEPDDAVSQLRALLSSLDDCRRILQAVRA